MAVLADQPGRGPLATLQRFVRRERTMEERCELCAAPLAPVHEHLLELKNRRITCVCPPCAILFGGSIRQPYRRIPRDLRRLRDFAITDQEWESLLIPINLAFFTDSTFAGRTIVNYPSPAGTMESSLDTEYWDAIVKRNPMLKTFGPDVEALLVNRVGDARQYYRAPIDQCFRLVGIIRTHWRGLSGGTEVWKQIESFFSELDHASGGHRA